MKKDLEKMLELIEVLTKEEKSKPITRILKEKTLKQLKQL